MTNDTFAPLRALRWKRPSGGSSRGRSPRPRVSRLTSLGPPEGVGRWSLVDGQVSIDRTERAHALATSLLERHGVVTREAVVAEGVEGGFAAAYPVLRAMEEGGRIRRGYFVDGLGAAQFALPGAIDRLRAMREPDVDRPVVHVLAAADPANPYGAALAWPRRGDGDPRRTPARAAGAYVVLVDGAAALYVERGGGSIAPLPPADDPEIAGLGLAVAPGAARRSVARAHRDQGRRRSGRRVAVAARRSSVPGSSSGIAASSFVRRDA